MTRPCGCGGNALDQCPCAIVGGANTSVTGTGNPEDPYVVTAGTTQLTVTNTDTVGMTLAGDGAATPYNLSAAIRLNPAGSSLLTSTPSGLLVACADVQDCVAEALGSGLEFDTVNRLFRARLSTQAGNTLLFGPDGGLYNSADGTVAPALPRARLGKATAQEIPNSASTTTVVAFDQPLVDNAGMFTATGRLTAPVAGGYTVGAQVQWQTLGANANQGHRAVFLRRNGTQMIAADQRDAVRSFSTLQNISVSLDLAAGDYVEVLVQQLQGAPINLLAANGFVPTLWMYLTTEGT